MKRTFFYLMLLALSISLIGFTACSSDDDPEEPVRPPYLRAEQTLYEIDATAQTITVTLNTNIPNIDVWVPDEYPWVQLLEIKDAENSKTLLFQIAVNTEGEPRQGAVAIKDPENRLAAVTITIRQSAAD
jgi:hypothetical protein